MNGPERSWKPAAIALALAVLVMVAAPALAACGSSETTTAASPSPSPSSSMATPHDYRGIWVAVSGDLKGTRMVIKKVGGSAWLAYDQHFTAVQFDGAMKHGRLILTSRNNHEVTVMRLGNGTLHWTIFGGVTLRRLSD